MLSDMVGPSLMAEEGERSPLSPDVGKAARPEETEVAQSSPGLGAMGEGVVGDPAGTQQLTAPLTLHWQHLALGYENTCCLLYCSQP